MRILAKSLSALLAVTATAQDEAGWKPLEGAGWPAAAVLANGERKVWVLDEPAQTRLRGSQVEEPAELTIGWSNSGRAENFERFAKTGATLTRSIHRLGTATLTRTVMLDPLHGATFIHLHADQPGALHFRVKLESHSQLSDRRELVTVQPAPHASHVWVWPFEADVEPDAGGIRVRGEGEALIVWAFGAKDSAAALSKTWSRLAERYDPGQQHPDPSRIWRSLLEDHLKRIAPAP